MTDVLYGALGGSNATSDLYTIDPLTAVATSVGPIGFAITGLAVDPITEILYGATSNNSALNPRCIIVIDRDTGAGTLVGPEFASGTRALNDICFDSTGQMYGWIGSGGTGITNRLATVDKVTGLATPVGTSGIASTFGNGIDCDSVDAPIACLRGNDGAVYTINTGTGAATPGPTLDGDGNSSIPAASFTVDKSVYYAITNNFGGGNTRLVTINLGSGVISDIGATTTDMDSIAWAIIAPPPPPPPPFSGRIFADLPWRVLVTSNLSRTLSVLDKRATGKQFLYTLNAPAYHTGQVASDEPEINRPFPDADSPALIAANVRLVYALQRWPGYDPPYQATWGGILFGTEDQGADAATTTYQAYDPWQYMMSRPVRDPDSGALPGVDGLKFPPGSRASNIALALLETTQIVEGETHIDFSDAGLIEDTEQLPYGIVFDEGSMVGEAWQQLCATGTIDITLPPLYDPVNFPGKVVRFATSPRAGQIRYNAVMAWDKGSHSLSGLSRMVDGTRLADRVLFFAGQGGVPVPLQSDASSIAAHGEYWAQQFFPGTHDRNLVELLALAELQIRKNGARSISFSPAPERSKLVLRDYGLGDYLPVWASKNLREPLGIDYDGFDADFPGASGYQRAYAIPVAVDDNGVATVSGILTSNETAVGG